MFLTFDPQAQFDSQYSYTGWNPVNRMDPDGEDAVIDPGNQIFIIENLAGIMDVVDFIGFLLDIPPDPSGNDAANPVGDDEESLAESLDRAARRAQSDLDQGYVERSWTAPTSFGLTAFGFSIDLSIINPFTSTGGGTYGINLEYTSDTGWNIYVLSTPNNVQSIGFEVGLAGTFNFALGRGDWTGPFETYTGSYGFLQGGFFHTPVEDPNPGYFGVQFGGALGFPGVGGRRVNYQTLSDFLRED